jgi:hypothetical protein
MKVYEGDRTTIVRLLLYMRKVRGNGEGHRNWTVGTDPGRRRTVIIYRIKPNRNRWLEDDG